MNQPIDWKKLFIHAVAVLLFLLVAVIYCRPILLDQVLSQSDIAGWMGMVHQMQQYKAVHGHFPLWNNSMFGGMPAYQIALESRYSVSLGFLHQLLTLFLPAPLSFFFLLCISFYFLTQVLKINPWIGMLGALMYGYASFSPILVSAGHETEILAMGYVPFALGALILLYEGRYWWGTTLTGLFSSLLVGMNHPQILYYFLLIAVAVTVAYVVRWVRTKNYKRLFLAGLLASGAGALGALTNATTLFTTYEYSMETMRNGGLVQDSTMSDGKAGNGLPIDYAFQWSYGRAETYTLMVPNIYGGASVDLGKDSRLAHTLQREHLPSWESDQFFSAFGAYWGDQPDTSGPVYLGAIVCFLFLFGCFYSKSPHKAWIVALTVLAICMAWGRHFAVFNDFLFRHLPLYNKFRVPSMILFIPQLTVPILVVLSLQQFFFAPGDKTYIIRKFNMALLLTGAILLVGVGLYTTMDFLSAKDLYRAQYLTQINKLDPVVGKSLLQAAAADRQALFGGDLLRSTLFVVGAVLLMGFYIRGRLKMGYALAALSLLVFTDLILVDTRYLNYHSYMNRDDSDLSITPTPADQQISRDTSYYRVLNLSEGVNAAFQESGTSYFHNSLGGYHPARLALIEDLINHQLSKEPINQSVLNMFNTKYVIVPKAPAPVTFTEDADPPADLVVMENRNALGPCWFVSHLDWVNGPAASMKTLDHFDPSDSAVIEQTFAGGVPFVPRHSMSAHIDLIKNDNDLITYTSSSHTNEFAVFSEIYYAQGWKAYIDQREVPIVRVDYALRGLAVPAGHHLIRFEFKPASFYEGERVAAISTWLMLLLLLGTLLREIRARFTTRRVS
jgi:hypothetical protein